MFYQDVSRAYSGDRDCSGRVHSDCSWSVHFVLFLCGVSATKTNGRGLRYVDSGVFWTARLQLGPGLTAAPSIF